MALRYAALAFPLFAAAQKPDAQKVAQAPSEHRPVDSRPIELRPPDAVRVRFDSNSAGVPVVLTIEGGGTLGVYEGGLTWTLVELFKRQRAAYGKDSTALAARDRAFLKSMPRLFLAATSGASAGSINALLASVSWCQADLDAGPQESDFWQAWLPIGLPQLLPPERAYTAEAAIFSRRGFDQFALAPLHDKWSRAMWQPDCQVELGAAITRLFSDQIEVGKIATARNQRWAGVVSVTGGSGTSGPIFTRPPDGALGFARLGRVVELPFDSASKQVSRDHVEQLIKASSGYPLAFAPLSVPYKFFVEGTYETLDTLFVDGGVFDNGPILLGYGLGMAHQNTKAPSGVRMVFITPDHPRKTGDRIDKWLRATSSIAPQPRGLEAGMILVSHMIPSARQYELQVTQRILGIMDDDNTSQEAWKRRLDTSALLLTESNNHTTDALKRIERDSARLAALINAFRATADVTDSITALTNAALCRLRTPPCAAPDTMFLSKLDTLLTALAGARPDSALLAAPVAVALPGQRYRVDSAIKANTPPNDGKYVTSRYHPLAGEWFNGFGGLFGYPLRAYDFFVGIYDGLHLVADQLLCPSSVPLNLPDSADSRALAQKRAKCVMESTLGLIDHSPLALADPDKAVLRRLYDIEYAVATPDTSRRGDITTEWLVLKVADVMARRMISAKDALPNHCGERGFADGITCSTGMDATLGRLKEDGEFDRAIAKLRRECTMADQARAKCLADDEFQDFLDDPARAMDHLVARMLWRLDQTTPDNVGSKKAISLLEAVYLSKNHMTRTGLEFGQSSIPENEHSISANAMRYLLPTSIGGFPGHGGISTEWVPLRYHFNRLAVYSLVPRAIFASNLGFRDNHDAHVVYGLSARGERKACWILSSCGLESGYWRAQNQGLAPDTRSHLNYGITATAIANKVRISILDTPPFLRTFSHKAPFATVALNDVNGLVYWLTRLH